MASMDLCWGNRWNPFKQNRVTPCRNHRQPPVLSCRVLSAGLAIIGSGFKLMRGYLWARTVLEIFSAAALCASLGWLIYSASHLRHIHSIHVFQGAMFFLVTGAPAIV